MNKLLYYDPIKNEIHEVWFAGGRYLSRTEFNDSYLHCRFKIGSHPSKVGWELIGEL